MKKLVDTQVYALAELFMEDTPELASEENTHDLAATIQDAIEGWYAMHEPQEKQQSESA